MLKQIPHFHGIKSAQLKREALVWLTETQKGKNTQKAATEQTQQNKKSRNPEKADHFKTG